MTQGSTSIAYAYDTAHRRVSATTSTNGTAVSTNLYLWDDATGGYAELNSAAGSTAGGTWSDYFTAKGSMVGMLRTPPGGPSAMSYFHTDAQGSIYAISNDNGVVASGDIYSFDPWGKRRVINGTDDDSSDSLQRLANQVTTRGYIQQEEIAGLTNLQNLNARLYNPHIGRFVSADPAGIQGGANVYAYAGNNPVTKSDPTGMAPVSWTGAYQRFGARIVANDAWEQAGFGLNIILSAVALANQPDLSGIGSEAAKGHFGASVGSNDIYNLVADFGAPAVAAAISLMTGNPNVQIGDWVYNVHATPTAAQTQTVTSPAVVAGNPTGVAPAGAGATTPSSNSRLVQVAQAEDSERDPITGEADPTLEAKLEENENAWKLQAALKNNPDETLDRADHRTWEGDASLAKALEEERAANPKEGIYQFPDQAAEGTPYVGQSGNIPSRLAQHEAGGRLDPGTETTTEILGGKLAREIAEHQRIQDLTGGRRASSSPAVSNFRDPIGPIRRPALGLPDPGD